MTPSSTYRRLAAALLVALASAVVGFSGCEGPAARGDAVAADGPTGGYWVRGSVGSYHGTMVTLVNGFPLYRQPVPGMLSRGSKLDLRLKDALVSGPNVVGVGGTPFIRRSGDAVVAGPLGFEFWVEAPDGSEVPGSRRGVASSDSAYALWESELQRRWPGWLAAEDSALAADLALADSLAAVVASDPEAAYVGGGPALEAAWAWARANPVVVETGFVRPPEDGAPSFDGVFRGAPVIAGTAADSARLRAYAVHLRDLTAAADTAALWDAFEGKYADEFLWWGGEAGTGMDSLAYVDALRDQVVFAEAGLDWEPSDVRLRSWAGGRVWELYRGGVRPLFEEPGEGSVRAYQEVYVGEGPDGELRVVR